MFASSPFPRLFEFEATCLRPVEGVHGLQNWQTRRQQHSIKGRSEEAHRQSKPARLTNNIPAVSHLQPIALWLFQCIQYYLGIVLVDMVVVSTM